MKKILALIILNFLITKAQNSECINGITVSCFGNQSRMDNYRL